MTLIEKENNLDLQLYEFAQQLFTEQLAQQDVNFINEVSRFKYWNQNLYSPFITRLNTVDTAVRKVYWQMRKVSVREIIKKQINR